jgi:nucleoside-diphosphate-sugar epimerase
VRAFERPEAAGQRYLITSSGYSYQNVVDIIRERFPELREKTPKGNTGAPLPPVYRLDTSKAVKELGMKFRTLEETIVDTVNSFAKLQQ